MSVVTVKLVFFREYAAAIAAICKVNELDPERVRHLQICAHSELLFHSMTKYVKTWQADTHICTRGAIDSRCRQSRPRQSAHTAAAIMTTTTAAAAAT